MPSQRRCLRQCLRRADPGTDLGCGQHQAVVCERASLVKYHGIHCGKGLKSVKPAHQHTPPRQSASGGQHGRRCGERQRTGASHHQHRHRHHQRVAGVLPPPISAGQSGCSQHRQQEGSSDAVGQSGQPGPTGRDALHQRHDTGKARVRTDLDHPDLHDRQQVVAAGNHRAARATLHRVGLASQQRLVDPGVAQQQLAIGRKGFARQHLHHIAGLQASYRHPFKVALRCAARHAVGQTVHQGLQRAGGLVAQPQLQPAAEQQKGHEHGE